MKETCIYRDQEYEQATKAQLEQTRKDMQALFSIWIKLDIGEADINEILMQPEQVYQDAIDHLVETPPTGGRFAVRKDAHLSTLELPDPEPLYQKAKSVRQRNYAMNREQWSTEGKTVVLNEQEAEKYITAMNIYTSSPEAVELAQDLNKLVVLINSLNKRTQGQLLPESPWTYHFFLSKFNLQQRLYNGLQEISLDREWLRTLI